MANQFLSAGNLLGTSGAGLGNYSDLLGYLGYQTLTGNTTNAFTVAGGTNTITYSYAPQAVIAPAIAKDDAVSWLKRRVEEVCWREAA